MMTLGCKTMASMNDNTNKLSTYIRQHHVDMKILRMCIVLDNNDKVYSLSQWQPVLNYHFA